ncbi:MerR family transcriptional regulator [Marinospirillum perlucidum]|uniref:MerR family transcriptional regulator n=1 Tax=Marinospirillum perlucidum TaxID=1982602 RepID=UPI001FE5B7C5|nr:MerR family transcriptional regulator [Marinospirillum perlucidum]
MTSPAQEEGANPLYPIREVSRLTGVNTVTLRAWERRYGLICPQRTPKGHRLYSAEDIDTIRRILQWLDKGVAVSQVGDLLDKAPQAPVESPAQGCWSQVRQEFMRCLQQGDETQLDQLYNQLFTSWSASQLAQELLAPLVQEIGENSAEAVLLARYLRTRLGERYYHRAPHLAGPRLTLLPLETSATPDWPLLLALLSLVDLDFQVFWLDAPLEPSEYPRILQQQRPRLLFITGRHPQRLASLKSYCQQEKLGLVELSEQPSDQNQQPVWKPLDSTRVQGLLQEQEGR